MWEEPCISGTNGAGTVFFSGCTLGCVFCQNRVISRENFGKTVTGEELYAIFERLAEQGAHNIELVTPTQYTHELIQLLKRPMPGNLPVNLSAGALQTLHAQAYSIFRGAITDTLHDAMEPEII
jgi:putative pyruvate formate lyase activating enzyme